MINEYPAGYVNRIKAVDAIIFLAGLIVLAGPAIFGFYPGAIETTVHITLGALIATCAVFRVLVAWGSAWLEIVLCALGVLTFLLPKFMHLSYDPKYNTLLMVTGAVIIVFSLISALMTFGELKKHRQTA
jgi:hypothetical protein